MPQVAPMSWLLLFSMFSIASILFINYFFTIYQPIASFSEFFSLPQISLNWKW